LGKPESIRTGVAEGVVRGAFKASLEALCTSSAMSDIVTEAGIKN